MEEERLTALIQESLAVATRTGAADFSKVIVDTTVQPKAVVFPTDAKPHAPGARAAWQWRSEALARGEDLFGRLDVRWPFAFRRSLTPRPVPCGGSRGRGSHARHALRAGGAGAPLSAQTPDLQTPRSHQETWAGCLTRTFAPT
jgi:hypothetical protein